MSDQPKPVDLEALDALRKKATQGPLRLDEYTGSYIWGPNNEMVGDVHDGEMRPRGLGGDLPIDDNIAYTIAAYNAVPALIQLIRQLEAEASKPKDRESVADLKTLGDAMAQAITEMNGVNCRPDVRGGFMESLRTIGNALDAQSKWYAATKEATP
jgi:hypothetical protein